MTGQTSSLGQEHLCLWNGDVNFSRLVTSQQEIRRSTRLHQFWSRNISAYGASELPCDVPGRAGSNKANRTGDSLPMEGLFVTSLPCVVTGQRMGLEQQHSCLSSGIGAATFLPIEWRCSNNCLVLQQVKQGGWNRNIPRGRPPQAESRLARSAGHASGHGSGSR